MARARPVGDGLEEAAVDLNKGHRDRARARFMANGGASLADYELLELLLFPLVPQRDTKAMAKELLQRFGSIAGVLAASPARLKETKYLGDSVVVGLKVLEAAHQRMARDRVDPQQPLLSSWSDLLDYCRTTMAYESIEQFRVLFLDKKNRLIEDEVQQTGTVDHTPVYPREVLKRSLELGATALILVHNHPSGDPAPSAADIHMTRQIIDVAKPLNITVHDHIIIGRNSHTSLKGLKLI